MDLTDDPEIKKALKVQFTAFELGRPYFVSDGVPADRVAALRRAFDLAMKDKDLLADADKLNQEVNPFTGEEMQKVLAEVYATPQALIERLAEASKSKPDLKVLESSRRARRSSNGRLSLRYLPHVSMAGLVLRAIATSDMRMTALKTDQRVVCATRGGVARLGPARLIMLSSRSRSLSKLASVAPSSTRPRGSRNFIGSTVRPLTMIS